MKEHWTSGAFIVILTIAFLFGPSFGASIYSRLSSKNQTGGDIAIENQALRAQLAELTSLRKDASSENSNYKTALIYSRYPFNFKNEVVINAGKKDGLNDNDLVGVASQGNGGPVVFLGSIKNLYDKSASVRTIFDPDFQAAVKIGKTGVDALMKGGTEPKLTMISKDASIAPGDAVYSVSPELPYGMAIGEVDKIFSSNGQFFIEASLRLPYDINLLKYVSVIPSVK